MKGIFVRILPAAAAGAWLAAVMLFSPQAAQAQSALDPEPLSNRDLHVWGRFSPGAWKQVRIVTETLGDSGDVAETSIAEVKTTLLRADSHSVRLSIDMTLNVAGKKFERPQQIVEYGYFSEQPQAKSEIKTVGIERLAIDGQLVPCEIRQVVAQSGQQQQVTRIYQSDAVEPFVLKRDITLSSHAGRSPQDQQTNSEVIALDMPYKVLGDVKAAAFERTIQRSTKGTSVSLDITCIDVPGGIVARTSKELDEKGRLQRRSTMELVDYHVVLDGGDTTDDGPKYLTRRQARKARRH